MLLPAFLIACRSADLPNAAQQSSQEPTKGSVTVDDVDASGGQDGQDAGSTPDAATAADAASDAFDAGSPIDARPYDANSRAPQGPCVSGPLAFWAVGAAFDPSVIGVGAATWLNPLFANQHPISIVAQKDASQKWTVLTSGTALDGIGIQYLPYDHTATAVDAQNDGYTLTSSSDEDTAWLHFADAMRADVWIPIVDVHTTATFGDDSCTSLASAQVTALIPWSAGDTQVAVSQSVPTILKAILGQTTSGNPHGWNVKLLFTGEKVTVSLK